MAPESGMECLTLIVSLWIKISLTTSRRIFWRSITSKVSALRRKRSKKFPMLSAKRKTVC